MKFLSERIASMNYMDVSSVSLCAINVFLKSYQSCISKPTLMCINVSLVIIEMSYAHVEFATST
jgi:hypothetical protein